MASAGMPPADIVWRMEYSDGGAILHKTYLHLDEVQKRVQPQRVADFIAAELDNEGAAAGAKPRIVVLQGNTESGQYWDRTSDPSRVKRVLSR